MQRFFFPRSNSMSHRRSSSQGCAASNTRSMPCGTGGHYRCNPQPIGHGVVSSSRRSSLGASPSYVSFDDLLETIKQSSPFLTRHRLDSAPGPLPQSGRRPGPIPLDTSIQLTIIDDTLNDGRGLFYVMTCSRDELDRVLHALCPGDKTIKVSTGSVPSMYLCSAKALDELIRHGYSVTLEIGWKSPSRRC